MVKRSPHVLLGGTWQMVQGHIEPGEKAWQTALRELAEETALRPLHFWQVSFVNRFYLAATDQIVLSPVFAVEVDANQPVVLSDEHTEHLWVDTPQALRMLQWPGQREAVAIILAQFVDGTPHAASSLDALAGIAPPAPSGSGGPAAAARTSAQAGPAVPSRIVPDGRVGHAVRGPGADSAKRSA